MPPPPSPPPPTNTNINIPPDHYSTPIDFPSLAHTYPAFAHKLIKKTQLNWSDPDSLVQLTLALAHRDFNLTLTLPSDRLCPAIPNRFAYVCFVQRLLDTSSPRYTSRSLQGVFEEGRSVRVLDVGCGASCVYPLIGCRLRRGWGFVATEVDVRSVECARENVRANGLGERVDVRLVGGGDGGVLDVLAEHEEVGVVDVVMMNPPFYESEEKMRESAEKKKRKPNSACTGVKVEMVWEGAEGEVGGEVGFVGRLIVESAVEENRMRVQWCSAMLGHLSSVPILIGRLRDKGCDNYAVTEFVQGETRRWCVAWSWWGFRPTVAVARGTSAVEKKELPAITEMEFTVDLDLRTASIKVNDVMDELEDDAEVEQVLSWQWKAQQSMGLGMVKEDCWSRKARRKRMMVRQGKVDQDMKENGLENGGEDQEPKLVFEISISERVEDGKTTGVTVHVRWLQGHDSVLFESFCGWLKRKIEDR